MKQQEFCVMIGRGNFAITKPSHSYRRLDMEGRRIIDSQDTTLQIDQICITDVWDALDNVFTK